MCVMSRWTIRRKIELTERACEICTLELEFETRASVCFLGFLGRRRLYHAGTYLTTLWREQRDSRVPGRNKLECLRWIFLPFLSFPLFACPVTRERRFLSPPDAFWSQQPRERNVVAWQQRSNFSPLRKLFNEEQCREVLSFSARISHVRSSLFNRRNRRRFGSAVWISFDRFAIFDDRSTAVAKLYRVVCTEQRSGWIFYLAASSPTSYRCL